MPFVACSLNVAGFCHNFQVIPHWTPFTNAWVRIITSLTMVGERIESPACWGGGGINGI